MLCFHYFSFFLSLFTFLLPLPPCPRAHPYPQVLPPLCCSPLIVVWWGFLFPFCADISLQYLAIPLCPGIRTLIRQSPGWDQVLQQHCRLLKFTPESSVSSVGPVIRRICVSGWPAHLPNTAEKGPGPGVSEPPILTAPWFSQVSLCRGNLLPSLAAGEATEVNPRTWSTTSH